MSVQFVFSLIDKMSAPAQKIAKAVEATGDAAKKADAAVAPLPGRLGKVQAALKDAYGDKASAMFGRFVTGTVNAGDAAKAVETGYKGLKAGAGVAQEGATKLAGGLAAVAAVAATAAAAVGAAGLGLAAAGAKYALDMARFKQDTAFAWKYSLGSAEQANTTLAYAQGIANKLGTSTKGVAAQLGTLFGKGLGSRESEMVVQMAADLKAMTGKDADVGPIADAIQAMKKGGGLTPEMLAPLTAMGPGASQKVFASLAKTLGVTAKTAEGQKQAVLARMGELKGQKGLDAMSKAFLATTGKSAAGDVAKEFQDTTLTGSIEKIQAKIEALFAALETSGAGKTLVSIMQKVAAAIDPGTESGKKLLATLDKAAAVAGRLLGKINIDQLIGGFDRLVGAVDAVMGPIEAFGEGLVQGFGEAFGTVLEVIDLMSEGQGSSTGFADALKTVGTALGYIVVGVGAGIGAIVMLEAKLAGMAAFVVGAAGSIGLALIDGMAGGIDSAKAKLVDRLQALSALLPDTVRKLLGIHSPSRVFAEIGSFTMQGFVQGVDSEADAVRDVTLSTLSPKMAQMGAGDAAGGASGARSVVVNNTIEINGGNDPAAVRQAAEEGATAGTMRVLELLGLEAGAVGP